MGQAPDGSTYNADSIGLPLIAGASDLGELTPQASRWTTSPTRVCAKDDVILCIRATIGDKNWADREYCLGRGVAGLRPKPGRVEVRYLWHCLDRAMPALLRAGRGATFLQVTRRDIEELMVLVPEQRSEQRRIADILDRADAIRRKRKEALALTDALLRSTFLEMFGDPVTNPKGWDRSALSGLAKITTGNTPPRERSDLYGDAIEWIKSDNIVHGSHLLTKASESLSSAGRAVGRTVPAGSTLITCIAGSPESIGKVALADREVAFNQQINAATPRGGTDYRFLFALLLTGKKLIQSGSSNSMKGMVTKVRLESIRFPVPPPEAQLRFGRTFDEILAVTSRSQEAVRTSEDLFASMMDESFERRAGESS